MQGSLIHSILKTGVLNNLSGLADKKEMPVLKTEEKYQNLIEQATDGIFIFDTYYNFISANFSGCLMLGYEKESLLELNMRDIIPAKYYEALPINSSLLKSRHGQPVEIQLIRKNGTLFCAELNIQVTTDGNIQAIVRDITDRKQVQEQLQIAIDKYDILFKATSDNIWDWDIVNNKMVYNDGITQLFNHQLSKVNNANDWWKINIHQNDLPAVLKLLEENFKKRNTKIQFEYRFRCDDGSFKYIYERALVIYDKHNNPIRMIGTMLDITNAKEKEKQMVKAIINAQKKERCHIGQELDDNINQILFGSLLTLNMTKEKHNDIEKISEYVEISKKHISQAINEIRKLSHDLSLISSEEHSLQHTFEGLLAVINLNNQFNIKLHFDEIDNNYISNDIQVTLYRIFQEQIKNIITHSQATSIEISVTLTINTVRMIIFDNGKGFNTKKIKKGIGFSNIKKRAESFSGKFILNSSINKGCEIIIEIPF